MTRRRRPVWPLAGVSLCLLASSAHAAPQRRDTGPLFTQVDTGQGAAAAARALAARGACAQALASFDIALHSSIDMSIRRDRGLCHEQLGNPFPAMDDYRAYLTVSPDAPDSPDIRARLERLEIQTGVGGPSANGPARSAEEVPVEAARINDTSVQTSDTGVRTKVRRSSYDAEEAAYHKYDDAMSSPLRRGTGGIFGVYGTGVALGIGFGGAGGNVGFGGGSSTFIPGFEIGAKIGWSFSQVSSFYGQIGYVDYQVSQVGLTIPIGGVGLALGYEARIRLDQYSTHAIVLGPAFEYQYVTAGSAAGGSGSGGGVSVLIPEGRLGYRVILGYGFGLELVADAGVPIFFASGAQGASRDPIVGGTMSLLLAF
jgi:hypothetical protein